MLSQTVLAAPAAGQLIDISEPAIMHVWQATITDEEGDIVPGATIEVRDADEATLVSIFSDRDGEVPKSNPFTVGSDGLARFYASPGIYDIRAFLGASQQVWADVELGVRFDSLPQEELANFILATVGTQISSEVEDAVALAVADILDQLASLPSVGIEFGYITANGTGSVFSDPSWTVTPQGSGRYLITHNAGLINPQSMVVTATAITTEDRYCTTGSIAPTSDAFYVQVLDVAGFGANNPFFFIAVNAEATTE